MLSPSNHHHCVRFIRHSSRSTISNAATTFLARSTTSPFLNYTPSHHHYSSSNQLFLKPMCTQSAAPLICSALSISQQFNFSKPSAAIQSSSFFHHLASTKTLNSASKSSYETVINRSSHSNDYSTLKHHRRQQRQLINKNSTISNGRQSIQLLSTSSSSSSSSLPHSLHSQLLTKSFYSHSQLSLLRALYHHSHRLQLADSKNHQVVTNAAVNQPVATTSSTEAPIQSPTSVSADAGAPTVSPDTAIALACSSPLLLRWCPPKLLPYLLLARVDKPVGTYLLLQPCLWSIALAAPNGINSPSEYLTELHLMLLMSVGAFVMRGAGCTINDIWDRDVDRRVTRTAHRPLAAGIITTQQALAFLAVQLTMGLAVVVQLNYFTSVLNTIAKPLDICVYLVLFAVICSDSHCFLLCCICTVESISCSIFVAMCSMPFVVAYPLMKRWINLPQLFLGVTFNWGVWVGWASMMGSLDFVVLTPMYLGAICWVVMYDTIYAHQDMVDDRKIGVKSSALTFGEHSMNMMRLMAASTIGLMSLSGYLADLGFVYQSLLWIVGSAHLYRTLATVNIHNRQSCHQAFIRNVQFGWILLVAIILDKLFASDTKKANDDDQTEQPKPSQIHAPIAVQPLASDIRSITTATASRN